MLKQIYIYVLLLSALSHLSGQIQRKFPTLIRSSIEDEIVILSADKPVYFPGDTLRLTVQRTDSTEVVAVTPILIIDGTMLKSDGRNIYSAVIPRGCAPGQYRVRLGVLDVQGRRFVFETDCAIDVEEYQGIAQINQYAHIEPDSGGLDPESAVTLERNEIRNLRVVFLRDSIRTGMGPQFITIRTSVQLRDGTTTTSERRVLTFRSDNDSNRDRAMLIKYRTAYGAYAAIRSEEFTQVRIHVDSLSDWAVVKVNIEPDYAIKIGEYDRSNSYTRYFRVKGPMIEMGFSLGIPKVLFDSQAKDTISYGNSSAMLRFYYVNGKSGNRFPVNLGLGTFGVNSPLDVNVGRGGFALSLYLDVAELTRILGIGLMKKLSVGLEFAPFFSIGKRGRFLVDAQVGLAL